MTLVKMVIVIIADAEVIKKNLTVSSIISSNLALKHLNSKTGRKFKLSSYPKAIFLGHWLHKGLCR